MAMPIRIFLTCLVIFGAIQPAGAQDSEAEELREKLEEISTVERKMMVPSRWRS